VNTRGKHPDLIVQQQHPFNAEPTLTQLLQAPTTPNDLFFARNHAPVPAVDVDSYRLSVTGLVEKPLELSLDDVYRLPKTTVTATLQCAGNRRKAVFAYKHVVGEVPWGDQAISNAVWGGVRLSAVLERAGVLEGAQHVACLGLDELGQGDKRFNFGGSIPLKKARCEEVLLAYEMNGAPLLPLHGFPLRLVAPGYIGARSVKWLVQICVQQTPSSNHYQARAYKLFAPHIDAKTVDWDKGLMLGEMSVNSSICVPEEGETLASGKLEIKGYAITGGDRTVERVEVSLDGGLRWVEARLSRVEPFAWCFWTVRLDLEPGTHCVVARAWDSAANTQPEDLAKIWNFKGYMNNAWPRVAFDVGPAVRADKRPG